MPLATVFSRAKLGIDAPLVTVEVHLSGGLPAFNIVGLPEATVRESRDRVRSAIVNSRFEFPVSRITVNLAPADLPKEGGRFDLPIAVGILLASGQVPAKSTEGYEFIGELGLSGELRPVSAALPGAVEAGEASRIMVLPKGNGGLGSLLPPEQVREASSLIDVAQYLHGQQDLPLGSNASDTHPATALPDLIDVKGQTAAKRALEIAAAGAHSMLMSGPPGTGKTLLASRLPGIMPPLTHAETLDIAKIQSVLGQTLDLRRPFRSPHHSASGPALVGGGSPPRPGEISKGDLGVVFLDELTQFSRHVLEVLREPLESGEVIIARATQQVRYPCRFQLIAAMNPCPCGYDGDPTRDCKCTPDQIQRYRSKISGPLLDRIDIRITVPRMNSQELLNAPNGETSATVQQRVTQARQIQLDRAGKANAQLSAREIDHHCPLDEACRALITKAEQQLQLSGRAQHRIIKLARTIADLAGDASITPMHIQEALMYRGVEF